MPARWDLALLGVLEEPGANAKAAKAQAALKASNSWDLSAVPAVTPPDRPARPEKPDLVPPQQVPRRGLGSPRGRGALLHALAHIELNAVDLAADMALRFAAEVSDADRAGFVGDWIRVMGEEGLHFSLLVTRLEHLGVSYGDHPAHDGLWDAARKTKDDLEGRLAVAPMILEARGLDVTPGLIEKLDELKATDDADVLRRIYQDEIGHVRAGVRWFTRLAQQKGEDPAKSFRKCVTRHFPGGPKPPFNVWARDAAEFPGDWYISCVPQKDLC